MTYRNAEPANRPGRVVLGVATSLSGMQALRVAVEEARRRGASLHAVRAWGSGPVDTPADARPGGPAAGLTGSLVGPMGDGTSAQPPVGGTPGGALAAAAAATVDRAFTDTMGGHPPDVQVRAVVLPDAPGPVLVEYATRDDDLLVLGSGGRRLLRRVRGSPVVRYCLSRAGCPVLVVPPPPLTRAGSTRSLLRQLRREIDQLTDGGAER